MSIRDYFVVPDFLVNCADADLHIRYAIALDLYLKYRRRSDLWHRVVRDDDSTDHCFLLVKLREVTIHYGPYIAIGYTVEPGTMDRLPRITFAEDTS